MSRADQRPPAAGDLATRREATLAALPAADDVRPTAAPAAMAGGIMLIFSGITMHWLFSVAGAGVFLAALGRWIAEVGRQGSEHPTPLGTTAEITTHSTDEGAAR